MIVYDIISIYFFIMILSVIYWASAIKSLNHSGYTQIAYLLSLVICIYIFGYAMELNSSTAERILFWNRFEYLGIPFVSALWFTVSLLYTGHFKKHKKLLIPFIFVIPVITMVLRFTNDWHHLYFSAINFITFQGRFLLVRSYGVWMYVQTFHSMLMIFASFGLFIRELYFNQEVVRGKIKLIAIASAVAVAGLVLSFTHPFGLVVDYMAICLPYSCLMVIIAIVRYDFLDVKALARSKSFDSNQDALLLVSRRSRVIDYNKAAQVLFAQIGVEISNSNLAKLFTDQHELLEKLQQEEPTVIHMPLEQENRYYEVSTRWVGKQNVNQISIKTIRDITEAYELNQSLIRQAMMDELSNLHNRRAFVHKGNEMILQALQNQQAVYLLMMDLDHFKHINDTYGHQIGDNAIKRIGSMLRLSFPKNSLIARLGGEEFGVLLSGFTEEQVIHTVKQFIRFVAEQSYTDQGKTYTMTISVGIARQQHPQQDLYGLMLVADKALYRAKAAGRNQMVNYADIQA